MKQKKKQPSYRPKKKWGTNIIPVITLTVLAAILSLALAGLWQMADPVDYDPREVAPWKRQTAAPPESPASHAVAPPQSQSQSAPEPTPPPTPTPTPQPEASDWTALVPKSEWAASDYFDDALFVGDSITEGIKIYNIMSNAKVLSSTGINLDNIFTKPVVKAPGAEDTKITIIEAARAEQPGKIYLLMGANSMLSEEESFVKSYGRLVDELKNQHPQALIYVQSILPVTATYAKNRPDFANEKIDEYNRALEVMAQEKKVFYLNVAEVFKDEQGALPNEASPKDGMHFSSDWYRKWFDYLRNHTAEAAGTPAAPAASPQ